MRSNVDGTRESEEVVDRSEVVEWSEGRGRTSALVWLLIGPESDDSCDEVAAVLPLMSNESTGSGEGMLSLSLIGGRHHEKRFSRGLCGTSDPSWSPG